MKTSCIVSFIFLLIASSAFGQNALDIYVQEALDNNSNFKIKKLELDQAYLLQKIAKGGFLPSLSFSSDYILSNGGRSIGLPIGDLLNPVYAGLYQLTDNNAYHKTLPNINEYLYPNNFHQTRLNFVVPIWDYQNKLLVLKSNQKIEILKNEVEVQKRQLCLQVKSLYLSYLKIEHKITLNQFLGNYLKDLETKTKLLHQQGLLEKESLDYLKYEISKHALNSTLLKSKAKSTQQQFNLLLNSNLDRNINIIDLQQLTFLDNSSSISLLPEQELLNNLEQLNSIDLKKHSPISQPVVKLSGQVGYEGYDYVFTNNEFYFLKAGISWTLFTGFTKHNQRQSLLLEKEIILIKKENLNQELNQKRLILSEELKNHKNRLLLEEERINLAENILANNSKKYLNQLIDITELLKFKYEFQQAKTEYIQSSIDYQLSLLQQQYFHVNP